MTLISNSSSVRPHAGIPGRRPTRRTRAVAARFAPRQNARWNAQAEASEEQPYTGGDIWLVEGVTGKNRLCNDYDVTQQRCRVWAHTVYHSAPKKKAMASGETSHTAASPAPAPAVAETEKKEKSQ
jgi:hypothetical protein